METSSKHLSLDDALETIAQSSTDNTVLVGGQAVSLWLTVLKLPHDSTALTSDIDWVGSREDAILANNAIKLTHELKLATMDDASINAAVISVKFKGESEARPIDYLMSMHGLNVDVIRKSAIEITHNSVTIKVIHPVWLMVSKLSNLSIISKQTSEGYEQARLSIKIVNKFIERVVEEDELTAREVLRLLNSITKNSRSELLLKAFRNNGMDVFEAIPLDFLSKRPEQEFIRFVKKGYPNALRQTNKYRKL